VLELSARTGEGLQPWIDWLREQELLVADGPLTVQA
jgi:hypothetical protein